jgi:hypothetical protein
MTLGDKIFKNEANPMLTNKFTDWESFQSELNGKIQINVPLRTTQQLDIENERIMDLIQEVAWNNTPQIKKKVIGNNYPLEIRTLIEQKRKARRTWQKTRPTENKTILNNLMQQLTREIRKIKNEFVNKYLQELNAESETATKYLKRPVYHKPPLKRENGTWAKENKEKAELFAEHLENTFTPNTSGDVEDVLDEVINEETGIMPPVSPKEVERIIRQQISPKKALGYDLITCQILKRLPRKAIIKIMHIINATFRMIYIYIYIPRI